LKKSAHSSNGQILVVKAKGSEEVLEIHEDKSTEVISGLDWGRILEVHPSPTASRCIVLSNHRHELLHVDLEKKNVRGHG